MKIIDRVTTVKKFTAQAISLGSKSKDERYLQSCSENNKSLFDKVNRELNKRCNH